ncbi:hypothetical protein [Sphaerisporangium sp. TRM90804]|uniref:hypothetical protein n=1 Tax=Sphaerisporangium sp. TRM90804 TaxID=3031113 RepID=UPI002447B89E|nr:hypothetical protein [Sphaerisporangium sp. TRM90804]MDH2425742.1 hypothetical protein [Sphaerisporangium sp. TRM90804]
MTEWPPRTRSGADEEPLQVRVDRLERELASMTAQRDLLREHHSYVDDGSLDHLLARIGELQADNNQLRIAAQTADRSELLRERDTNRRLEAELDRLQRANMAADVELQRRPWRRGSGPAGATS